MASVLKCGACGEENPVDAADPTVPQYCSTCFSALKAPPPEKPVEAPPAAPADEPPEIAAAAANPRNLFGPAGADGKPACVLIGPLGQDAMGAVYKAYDRTQRRHFAVRFMAGQAGEKESAALDERMQALVALPHPNILHVQGTGRRQNRLYIATDLVDAEPLSRSKIGDPSRLAALFRDAAEAVSYAHGAGIFHGDVNPENILVARSEDHVYLKDFQLANLLESLVRQAVPKEAADAELHNPAYLPPEQAKQSARTPSAAGDVYGLGATLYAALAGRPPFEGQGSAKIFARIQMEEPPALQKLRPDVPEGLAAVVRHAMAKEPALRYATANEMAEALARFLKGAALAAQAQTFDPEAVVVKPDTRRAAPPAEPPPAPFKMPRWAIPAAAGILAAAILFFVVRAFTGSEKKAPTPVVAALVEEPGQVELDLQPPPSEVRIDGKRIDASQKTVSLRHGRHRVEILFGDAHRTGRDLEVVPGGSEKIEVRAHEPIAAKREEQEKWADAERLYQEALAFAGSAERRQLQEKIDRVVRKRLEAEFTLQVDTVPPGASVIVDGAPLGRTPLVLSRLKSGPHTLEFELEGHVPERRQVEVEPGRTPALRIQFRPLTGKVQVRGLLAGDRVKLESRTVEAGATGTVELDAVNIGPHEIFVERANHDDARAMVRVEANKTSEVAGLVFKVTPGSLVVESAPADAEVQLDGKVVGRTPLRLAELPPGAKKLRLIHSERSDWDGEVKVKGGEKAEVRATLPAMAKLTVVAHPEGTRLAGALAGATRAEARLKAGEHRVRVSHPDAGEIERAFRLAPGDDVTDTVDLWQLRGDGLEKAEKLEEAARAFARARPETRDQALPRLAEIWSARAEEAVKAGDWGRARQAAGQALKIVPAHARSREILDAAAYQEAIAPAEAAAARGDWAKVKAAAAKALAAKPGDARALELSRAAGYGEAVARGLELQKQARWDEARRAYEQALSMKPGDAEAAGAIARLKWLAWSEHRFFPGYAFSAAFCPAGKTVAVGRFDKTIELWSVETGKPVRTLTGHAGPVSCVAFSPDGRRLASGGADSKVKVWDLSTGAAPETLGGHSGQIWSIAYSPDGTRLASAGDDKTVRVWDTGTWTELRVLSGHASSVSSVAFSPDGKRLVTAGGDKLIKLWDADRGEELKTLTGHEGTVSQAVFSPDGKRVASAGGDLKLKLWDADAGRELRAFGGHTSHVSQSAFTPDGRLLLSGGGDQVIRLWDVETGRELRALTGHLREVWAVALAPDGTRMVTAGTDGARLWSLAR